jgi:hypothetical protein
VSGPEAKPTEPKRSSRSGGRSVRDGWIPDPRRQPLGYMLVPIAAVPRPLLKQQDSVGADLSCIAGTKTLRGSPRPRARRTRWQGRGEHHHGQLYQLVVHKRPDLIFRPLVSWVD